MITSNKEIDAYKKVIKTIESAEYSHMVNGTVENMINLFFNMYNNEILCNNISVTFEHKQKQLNINN